MMLHCKQTNWHSSIRRLVGRYLKTNCELRLGRGLRDAIPTEAFYITKKVLHMSWHLGEDTVTVCFALHSLHCDMSVLTLLL